MSKERWLPAVGCAGYEVSNHGRVRSIDRVSHFLRNGTPMSRPLRGQQVKPILRAGGYLFVIVGGRRQVAVHRMVAFAFLGAPTPPRNHVNHINRDKTDNRASNLEWSTPRENIAHSWANGRVSAGRVFSAEQVAQIRSSTARYVDLAPAFNVTPECISMVRRRITYKELP